MAAYRRAGRYVRALPPLAPGRWASRLSLPGRRVGDASLFGRWRQASVPSQRISLLLAPPPTSLLPEALPQVQEARALLGNQEIGKPPLLVQVDLGLAYLQPKHIIEQLRDVPLINPVTAHQLSELAKQGAAASGHVAPHLPAPLKLRTKPPGLLIIEVKRLRHPVRETVGELCSTLIGLPQILRENPARDSRKPAEDQS